MFLASHRAFLNTKTVRRQDQNCDKIYDVYDGVKYKERERDGWVGKKGQLSVRERVGSITSYAIQLNYSRSGFMM